MELPFENTVNTAIDKIADGVITKMNHAEERRNREFAYQLKELEFYKSNYEKDLKDIFDFWFEVVRVVHIKDNPHLSAPEQKKYNDKYKELIQIDKISRYKMKTIKYGGTETGRVLAIENKLHQKKYDDKPKYVPLLMWCSILSVLKKDILGQEISSNDIIQILVNNFDDNLSELEKAKKYVKKIYKDTYGEDPYWVS
ncbi:hypothetical protein [Flavonifractor sp. An4]|uniref:hypothetical protein n=1 Tax=Flavonifractor sp. An4 TaxID=1965634 RepID=UPI000B383959|nr:hypothetical protein [Flavonifractor sp. An4]OUO17955.1 hypothetical protein B5F94_00745 [Flavonifractor sp. An4]